MRIIAGIKKGHTILPPEDGYETTRPTLDRVKEAMFSILQRYIPSSVCLDLFAGTGSLGLEALSQGAKECFFVDESPKTFNILKKNIEKLNFTSVSHSYNISAESALKRFKDMGIVFDLIFIDPPYLKDMIPPCISYISENNLLKPDGVIMTKIDTSEVVFEGIENIRLLQKRKYGNTTLVWYLRKDEI